MKLCLRSRGIELTDVRTQAVEMETHRATNDKTLINETREAYSSDTQVNHLNHSIDLASDNPPDDDGVGVLHPDKVALRQLSDKNAPEFSSLALEADPTWQHIDPAAFRSFVAGQQWPRQLYMTHLCDIVYCRVTDECFVRWLPEDSPPRTLQIVPAPRLDGDRKEDDDRDASSRRFSTPPKRRPWRQTYPATEIPVPAKDYRWGKEHPGMPSCIGSRAACCDWVFSKTPDLGNQGPRLLVTIPEGDEFFLVPPGDGSAADS